MIVDRLVRIMGEEEENLYLEILGTCETDSNILMEHSILTALTVGVYTDRHKDMGHYHTLCVKEYNKNFDG